MHVEALDVLRRAAKLNKLNRDAMLYAAFHSLARDRRTRRCLIARLRGAKLSTLDLPGTLCWCLWEDFIMMRFAYVASLVCLVGTACGTGNGMIGGCGGSVLGRRLGEGCGDSWNFTIPIAQVS